MEQNCVVVTVSIKKWRRNGALQTFPPVRRVVRSPVFYGRSRISDPFSRLQGGSRREEQISRILLVRLSRHSDDTDTWKLRVKLLCGPSKGSSVLSIFAENSVRLSIGNLTTGLVFWHCAHSMRSRVYKTVRCPSVRLSVSQSVPTVERSSGVRRVCCWAPYAQKISIDGGKRPTAATAPQPGAAARRSAANAGNVMLTAELTRLNTDLS